MVARCSISAQALSEMWMPEALIKRTKPRRRTPRLHLRADDRGLSADFQTKITPCSSGGILTANNAACMCLAASQSGGRHRLGGYIPIGAIFGAAAAVGRTVRGLRERFDAVAARRITNDQH